MTDRLFLGIDGGGTACRARLEIENGKVLGTGVSGPAATRFGANNALLSIMAAVRAALAEASLNEARLRDIHAGIGLAGIGRKGVQQFLDAWPHPFASVIFESDGLVACLGAHGFEDGGIIILGTGSIGFARLRGETIRIGGYGFPVSDEASGADLSLAAIRLALRAADGRIAKTPLLEDILVRFSHNPHAVVDWMDTASATEYATFAPLVMSHAREGDEIAIRIVRDAAAQIELMINTLEKRGVPRLSLVGGLAGPMEQWLSSNVRRRLVQAKGDSIAGGILLAKSQLAEKESSLPKTRT